MNHGALTLAHRRGRRRHQGRRPGQHAVAVDQRRDALARSILEFGRRAGLKTSFARVTDDRLPDRMLRI